MTGGLSAKKESGLKKNGTRHFKVKKADKSLAFQEEV